VQKQVAGSVGGTPTVCVVMPDTSVGQPVKITVSFSYSWLPILSLGSTPVTGTATMRIEQAVTNFYANGCTT
jgi:hypothetical protein